jgi:hypothetical protein
LQIRDVEKRRIENRTPETPILAKLDG